MPRLRLRLPIRLRVPPPPRAQQLHVDLCQRHERQLGVADRRRQAQVDARQPQRGAQPVRQRGGEQAQRAPAAAVVLLVGVEGVRRRQVGLVGDDGAHAAADRRRERQHVRAGVRHAPQRDARAVDAAAEARRLDVAQRRGVVLDVARRRDPVARLAVGAAKRAVVKQQRREPAAREALADGAEADVLLRADAVRDQHDGRLLARGQRRGFWRVEPRLELLAAAAWRGEAQRFAREARRLHQRRVGADRVVSPVAHKGRVDARFPRQCQERCDERGGKRSEQRAARLRAQRSRSRGGDHRCGGPLPLA